MDTQSNYLVPNSKDLFFISWISALLGNKNRYPPLLFFIQTVSCTPSDYNQKGVFFRDFQPHNFDYSTNIITYPHLTLYLLHLLLTLTTYTTFCCMSFILHLTLLTYSHHILEDNRSRLFSITLAYCCFNYYITYPRCHICTCLPTYSLSYYLPCYQITYLLLCFPITYNR